MEEPAEDPSDNELPPLIPREEDSDDEYDSGEDSDDEYDSALEDEGGHTHSTRGYPFTRDNPGYPNSTSL